MKKIGLFVAALFMSLLFFAMPVQAKDYGIKKSYTLAVGRTDVVTFPLKFKTYAYYDFKVSNKKIAKVTGDNVFSTYDGKEKVCARLTGVKKGTTTVKVYRKNKKIAQFKVTVKSTKAGLKNKKNALKLKIFSGNGFKEAVFGSDISNTELIDNFIAHFKNGAKYSIKSSNKKIVKVLKDNGVKAVSPGNAKITVYETYKKKKVKVGVITVKVNKASYKDLLRSRNELYDDGLFGHGDFTEVFYLDGVAQGKDRLDMRYYILRYILKGFPTSQYTLSLTSSDETVASFNSNGVLIAHKKGTSEVKWTVKLKDGYTISESIDVIVYNNESEND